MTRFILVVAALFSVACAASLNSRIIGGATADDGQFPYQVSLRQYNQYACSGSILNERWVLTVAQCVYGSASKYMTVIAGSNNIKFGGDTYKVKRYIIHPDVDLSLMKNDIALVEIDGKIAFNDKVQPIALETGAVGDGADVVLSGWGSTSFPEGDLSIDLQFLALKSITTQECNERHVSTGLSVDDTQLCTLTHRGEGVCIGDSGNPLAHEGKLAGVVSWGLPCAEGYPDVFTRVSAFAGWINDNTQ